MTQTAMNRCFGLCGLMLAGCTLPQMYADIDEDGGTSSAGGANGGGAGHTAGGAPIPGAGGPSTAATRGGSDAAGGTLGKGGAFDSGGTNAGGTVAASGTASIGGSLATGGVSAGGTTSSGGVVSGGGVAMGGAGNAPPAATGGRVSGGVAMGGAVTGVGGRGQGGAATGGRGGGQSAGGPAIGTGGAATGGAATGGAATGGAATGGVGTGGKASGATTGAGGTTGSAGSTAAGGAAAFFAASAYTYYSAKCDDMGELSATMASQDSSLYIPTNHPYKNYVANSNWWNVFTNQTVDVNGIGFRVTNSASTSNAFAIGFPDIFIGTYKNNSSMGSNLPKQLSTITSVPALFDTNATSLDTSNFVATSCAWLTADSTLLNGTNPTFGAGQALVRVWLYQPSNRQPSGAITASEQTVGAVPNTWDVWVDGIVGLTGITITYVAKTPVSALAFDLNDFLADSTRYGVTSSMYLSVVYAGFEIWSGADGATVNRFCATVE